MNSTFKQTVRLSDSKKIDQITTSPLTAPEMKVMAGKLKFLLKSAAFALLAFVCLYGQANYARIAQEKKPVFTAEGLDFFEKKIRPVLIENCYGCHSSTARKLSASLLLDSRAGMLKGGASGQPAIVPGDPEASLLIKAIRYTDSKLQMPFAGKLPESTIKDFEAWVRMGAPDPRDSVSSSTAASPYDFNEAKKFWAFQPVSNPQLPQVRNAAWVKTPIDNFILSKLESKKLTPVGDADKLTLLRRASFDLTGLPPTPEECDAFLADKSPGAFEKVVDRLLASPSYGEKWGRHWLDVVRYADTAGDNSDYPVPSAYRYRNYVIEAFNKDKPYNQFIREQIAGDILAKFHYPKVNEKLPEEEADEAEIPGAKKSGVHELPKDKQEKIIATGYLAMSRRFGSRNKEMNLTIDDTIDNLGKTFLGLSTNCARCHDHKFDPIPQRDYYALYGIFNSSRYSFPGAEIYPHPSEMVALISGKQAENFYAQQAELEYLDDRKEFLTAEKGTTARNKKEAKVPKTESGPQSQGASAAPELPTPMRPADFDRDADNWGRAQASKRMPEDNDSEMNKVRARISELHSRYLNTPKAYAVIEGVPANSKIHRKGDPKNPGEEVQRGFLTILGGQKVPQDYKGSGRELLANWIADAGNPLTARVMVNRIWEYHFGKGIVATSNDFGSRGKAPTHPELLDYLASNFVSGGWSIKKMHKLIMLSHAYQLASNDNAQNSAIDVANDYLWKFNRRRLDAEEIRDAILTVSGQLDRSTGSEHPFPAETTWHFTQHVQYFGVYDTNKRSVYIMQQRLKKHPFFEVFDGADTNMSVGERSLSITPIQALFLLNNSFMHEQADALAVRVGMAVDTLAERVNYAYRLAYGRNAKPDELREAQLYMQKVRNDFQAGGTSSEKLNRAALASYFRVVLSSNEFLYLD